MTPNGVIGDERVKHLNFLCLTCPVIIVFVTASVLNETPAEPTNLLRNCFLLMWLKVKYNLSRDCITMLLVMLQVCRTNM
jgi:hypothetical protein